MFAGPNGSGKSTLKSYVPEELLGVYLNPDEMEAEILRLGYLDLSSYGVTAASDEVLTFFAGSAFLHSVGLGEAWRDLACTHGRLDFSRVPVNSYLASVAADFLRSRLLQVRRSFTFETVMSHPDKVQLLARAQQAGFRTYLYYVATDDPAINISRVRNRVQQGGHAVPEDRIESRYHRSLGLLLEAIRHTHRAYVFDNSGDSSDQKQTWVAEITDGTELELKSDRIPAWFQRAVLEKVGEPH